MAESREDPEFEKTPLQSKKFLAFVLADVGWKIVIVLMLFTIASDLNILAWGLMLAVIITAGFIQTGMILGQASLDKYVRIAKINANLGMGTSLTKAKVDSGKCRSQANSTEE